MTVPAADTASTRLALDFAGAVAAGDTTRAHGLLTSTLQSVMTPETLAHDYQRMVEYGEGPPAIVRVMTTMSAWPAREPEDTEWVYVAIANDSYSEAVTVVVTKEAARLAIRSVEWGRP